ncbi:MAG: isochorismatase family protein [Candidatus Micrarchaeota archaeon]|nr:isochorismatase family protein [Candidatus Micrarchaeota archaeon]
MYLHRIRAKTAVVVIDMQEKSFKLGKLPPDYVAEKVTEEIYRKCRMAEYKYGTLEQGIQRVCKLLNLARDIGIPILITESIGDHETIPRIIEAANVVPIQKAFDSAFSVPNFRRWIELLELKSIIVAGFEISKCVLATIRDAVEDTYKIKTGRVRIITSPELLFTGRGQTEERVEETLRFLREKTEFHEAAEGLIAAIHREHEVR